MTTFEKLRQALIADGTRAVNAFVGRDVQNLSPEDLNAAILAAYHDMPQDELAAYFDEYNVTPSDDDAPAEDSRFDDLINALLVAGHDEMDQFFRSAGMTPPNVDVTLAMYRARHVLTKTDLETVYARHGIVAADAPNLTDVIVIRHDRNGAQAPLVDVVRVPSEYVNKDCSGCAATDYLTRVVLDFANTPAGAKLREDGREPTWNDLFTIPASFLHERHVEIAPVEAYATVEVGMDEEVES